VVVTGQLDDFLPMIRKKIFVVMQKRSQLRREDGSFFPYQKYLPVRFHGDWNF
jgi:hypothetical protein